MSRPARPARYAWRLLVIVAVVAAIVGLGYLWRASPAASLISDGGKNQARRGFNVPGNRRQSDRLRNSSGFSLGNISDLVQTVFVGVSVLFGVVVIDKVRRSLKPIRVSGSKVS